MKTFLGIFATVTALMGYVPYFRDILAGKTKPHAFSWLVWFTLTAIGFAAQVNDGVGAGAWVTGFTAAVSLVIFALATIKGEKQIVLSDWICLSGVFIAMEVWMLTKTPLYSVILVTMIDALGYLPTFRKTYSKPHEETLVTFLLSGIKFIIALFALSNYSVVIVLYPALLVIMNGLFVAMLMVRRRSTKSVSRGILSY